MDFPRRFYLELERLFDAMDQPSIDGVNTYFVSKVAAESGMKAALSGLGGDELFEGYPSFKQVPFLAEKLAVPRSVPGLGVALRGLMAPILRHFGSPKYAGLMEYGGSYGGAYLLRRALFMPWELEDLMAPDFAKQGWEKLNLLHRLDKTAQNIKTPRGKISALELTWYMRSQLLRDSDWAGMAHSLEIRVPLVDVKVFRALAPLMAAATPLTKLDMARVPTVPLPPNIISRKKTGFAIPIRDWLLVGSNGTERRERGLRGWARKVARIMGNNKRFLVVTTDAFGGHGGIALYNRDLLSAMCTYPGCAEVVAFPRAVRKTIEPLPGRLSYVIAGVHGKLRYLWEIARFVKHDSRYDLLICGHINLLPLAYLLHRWLKVPLLLVIYGIDAWQPTRHWLTNRLVSKVTDFISISNITRQRFLDWALLGEIQGAVLPNAIHENWYGAGPKNPELLARYGLKDKKVLMTLGRLVGTECYKGFDEVIEQLPALVTRIPNIAYLIVGDGDDRTRLEAKAQTLGVRDRVVFRDWSQNMKRPITIGWQTPMSCQVVVKALAL